ncbi:MAG TPA: hypothetical protein VMF89_16560, partial [Polyangiales bacterium]|nr:hypothetical protein [Polyangiales bacterium]
MAELTKRLCVLGLLGLLAGACGSDPPTAAGKAEATSGSEDLSMTAMARRVGSVQTPVNPEEEEDEKKTSVPTDVPKLVDV